MSTSRSDDYLSDADAAIVLDRASELSVRRDGQVSVAELRSIAQEVGISPEVFDRALAEVRSAPVPVPEGESGTETKTGSPALIPSLWRLGMAALGGSLAALASGLPIAFGIDQEVAIVFSMILACISAAGLVTFRYPRREILEFEFDLASLWVGLTLAWMIFVPRHAFDILVTTGTFAGLAGGLGAMLIARSDAVRPAALSPGSGREASPEEERLAIPDGDSL